MSIARGLLLGSVLATSLLGLPDRGATSSSSAAFLERSLPKQFCETGIKIGSFHEGITVLAQVSGKRIVLPEGIADWLNERPEKNWQASTTPSKDEKVRTLLDEMCQILGMNWRYDADKDAIFLNFKWQRDDPRTTRELASLLVDRRPVKWTQLPRAASDGLDGFALDDWRRAFDTILTQAGPGSGSRRW